MKHKLLLLLLIFTVNCYGQGDNKSKEISNSEKFTERSGALLKREFIDIGTINKCKIQVGIFTDLMSNQKMSCVRFEYDYQGAYTSDTKIAHLDADEIEGLLKSIDIIQDKIFPTAEANYTEIIFKSRGGYEAGCYNIKDKWRCYMKLVKYDSKSFISMEPDDLKELKALLVTAKTKLS